MNETLIQIIFGWPFIALSLIVSVVGIVFNKSGLVLIGALFIIPFCYYLNGTPRFTGFALLLPIFQAGSAWAVKEDNATWPWILLSPTVAIILWLILVAAITNPR
jgi:hypothetical protein